MPRSNKGNIDYIFDNNKTWISTHKEQDPEYFSRWAASQKPQHLWIGCSDSRVVAEAAMGLKVGELFVHRNVGNVLSHSDSNAMSALEYSVKVLGVKHVLVCGHTNCGAVKAALTLPSSSALLTNCWISQIRDIRNQHVDELVGLTLDQQVAHLVKLNVMKQVFNVCTSPVLQQMWEAGSEVFVHGLVYDVSTGELSRLVGPLGGNEEVPDDLGAATSFPVGAALEGHTLDEALRKLADTLAASPSDASVQLQKLRVKGGDKASGNGSSARDVSTKAGSGTEQADADNSAKLSALLGLAQRASKSQGGSAEASMDSRVLQKMQSHLAFEEAAKQREQ